MTAEDQDRLFTPLLLRCLRCTDSRRIAQVTKGQVRSHCSQLEPDVEET